MLVFFAFFFWHDRAQSLSLELHPQLHHRSFIRLILPPHQGRSYNEPVKMSAQNNIHVHVPTINLPPRIPPPALHHKVLPPPLLFVVKCCPARRSSHPNPTSRLCASDSSRQLRFAPLSPNSREQPAPKRTKLKRKDFLAIPRDFPLIYFFLTLRIVRYSPTVVNQFINGTFTPPIITTIFETVTSILSTSATYSIRSRISRPAPAAPSRAPRPPYLQSTCRVSWTQEPVAPVPTQMRTDRADLARRCR